MLCKNCGNPLREGAAFCSKCGTAVKNDIESSEYSNNPPVSDYRDGYADSPKNENENTTQTVYSENENNEPTPDKLRCKKKTIIIIACVVLFLVIAIGVVIIVVNNAKSAPNNIAPSTFENSTETKMTEKITEVTQKNSTEPTHIPTNPPTTVPETESVTEASFSITQDEIEFEIENIRTYYYTPSNRDVQKVLENGQDGWNYSRDYRFHDDKLVFAFVFDGTEEHRLYFKDDHMIRYIDENHTTYDYPDTAQFSYWENKALSEAYTLIGSDANNGENQIKTSLWIGTWNASTGESLKITSVSDSRIFLVFNKLSEQGNMMNVDYEMEFDNPEKTIASEIGGKEDHGGWEYMFILDDGYITVKSRYPDQLFYKE